MPQCYEAVSTLFGGRDLLQPPLTLSGLLRILHIGPHVI